jgi:FkbM family methyltransferase
VNHFLLRIVNLLKFPVRRYRALCKRLPFKYKGLKFTGPDYGFVQYYVNRFFNEKRFEFHPKTDAPVIYDLGTNIGLSVIYFRHKFPQARIVTLDPDKDILSKYCYPNFSLNGIQIDKNLEVIEKAAWISNEPLTLFTDGKDGGAVERKMSDNVTTCTVEAIKFGDLLAREPRIDLLKMNIEGSEWEVLSECKDHLSKIGYLYFDYHGLKNEDPKLSKLLKLLEDNNFSYQIGGYYDSLRWLDEPMHNNIECGVSVYAKRRDY